MLAFTEEDYSLAPRYTGGSIEDYELELEQFHHGMGGDDW